MPSTTASLHLPIPDDADPFADGALAVRNLGNAVDALVPGKIRRGQTSQALDGSGDQTITHGLGITPTAVIATNGRNDLPAVVSAHSFTSTTFKVRFRVSTTGSAYSGTMVCNWIALA